MSQFIKFPTQIEPSRVTINLARVDEISKSPLTSAQQVLSRGNPAWVWTYSYVDLTEDERDIVQAFLLKCEGPVNTFKVTDPGDYEIKGSMSDWIDVYSGYGSFNTVAGSSSGNVNSWFSHSAYFSHHITDGGVLRFEWRRNQSASNLGTRIHGSDYRVNSLEIGKAYVQRVKYFASRTFNRQKCSFAVGSTGGDVYYIQSAPNQVSSSGPLTVPFISPVNTVRVAIVDWKTANEPGIGEYWEYADYRLVRCALVSNSENLLTRSNEFDHVDWSAARLNVDSGYADASPSGVTSGAWKLYTNAQTNTSHVISQSYTKIQTEDIYTKSIYARQSEITKIRLQIDDGAGVNGGRADFYLDSGSYDNVADFGTGLKTIANMFDVGSSWYRCQLTAVVSSLQTARVRLYLMNPGTAFTGNGSDGIEIFGGQLRKFPFMGQYVPTVASVVVGTDWQTGSSMFIEGLDPDDVIKSGQRFEITNQFHKDSSNLYERSEFKRTTIETKVHREGYAIVEFSPVIRNAPYTDRSWAQQGHLGETLHNPVIFHQPELKARLAESSIQYADKALKATDISFSIVEDLTE